MGWQRVSIRQAVGKVACVSGPMRTGTAGSFEKRNAVHIRGGESLFRGICPGKLLHPDLIQVQDPGSQTLLKFHVIERLQRADFYNPV